MRALKTALVLIAMLSVLGIVRNASHSASGDDHTISSAAADSLHDCGPMRYGETRADCVRKLQEVLRARGAPITATGNYLNQTMMHIKQFQAARGLRQDGVLNDRTLQALVDLPGDRTMWDLRRECVSMRRESAESPASQGRCVTALRSRLTAHHIDVAPGDQFDSATEAAVRQFQEAAGLPAIGVAGRQTKQALYAPRPGSRGRPAEPSCTQRHCMIYLSRGVTRDVADAFPDSGLARWALANAISALACSRVRAVRGIDIVCQPVGTYIADKVADTLIRAGRQNTCLEIRLGYPPGENSWFPLGLTPYTGANCRD